jgi:hypothetical protein
METKESYSIQHSMRYGYAGPDGKWCNPYGDQWCCFVDRGSKTILVADDDVPTELRELLADIRAAGQAVEKGHGIFDATAQRWGGPGGMFADKADLANGPRYRVGIRQQRNIAATYSLSNEAAFSRSPVLAGICARHGGPAAPLPPPAPPAQPKLPTRDEVRADAIRRAALAMARGKSLNKADVKRTEEVMSAIKDFLAA